MHKSINNLVSIEKELKSKFKDSHNVKIIAVSKTFSQQDIMPLIDHGHKHYGENKVQEAVEKWREIKNQNTLIKLHLIGKLQTNKVKQALDLFDVFHTVDREKLLKEFSKFPNKIQKKSFFIQVNTGKEKTKSGVNPEDVKSFFDRCKSYGLVNISGLMCIPPILDDPKKHFKMIHRLSDELGLGGPSIGMSSDYLDALDFDPQYIRLGTLLFGERK